MYAMGGGALYCFFVFFFISINMRASLHSEKDR